MDQKERAELYQKLNPAGIKFELNAYPDKIAEKKREMLPLKRALSTAELDCKQYAADLLSQIAEENDDKNPGKKYPNKEARENERDKRLRKDDQYKALVKKAHDAEDRVEALQIEIDTLKDKYKSKCYQLLIIAGELEYWAGGDRPKEDENQLF